MDDQRIEKYIKAMIHCSSSLSRCDAFGKKFGGFQMLWVSGNNPHIPRINPILLVPNKNSTIITKLE